MATTLAKYSGDYGDDTMVIASNDPTELTLIAEDFCFDSRLAAGYVAGVLPAPGAAFPTSGLVSVARDDQPLLAGLGNAAALGRPVGSPAQTTLTPSTPATPGSVAALGIDFTGTPSAYVHKTGLADNVVCHPPSEGFIDHVMMAWVRMTAVPGGLNVFGSVLGGGLRFGGNLTPSDALNPSITFGSPVAVNTWNHLAIHYDFDTQANTTTVRRFLNGQEVGAPAAGLAPTAYPANTAGGRCSVGGQSGSGGFPGTILRPRRVFTAIAGHALDPAKVVADEFAAVRTLVGI